MSLLNIGQRVGQTMEKNKYINQADKQYNELVQKIITNGYSDVGEEVRPRWKDGTPAHTLSVIGEKMTFDNSQVPIITSKRVGWKTAIKELLWIWQMKSNRVQDLRDMGVNIWNEWELEDGTIGRAYGYQLAKKNRKMGGHSNAMKVIDSMFKVIDRKGVNYNILDQVDYLLYQLKTNPSSRRHITTLWNPDDLDDMSLTPCVYETQWHVKENKLHLEVRCRSNDMGLGNPFNIFQYNVLQRMIAQVLGYELGEYIYHIGDAHIYDRHVEPLTEQINRETFELPQLWINPDVKNFYDFKPEDFKLIDYKYGEDISLEVAI